MYSRCELFLHQELMAFRVSARSEKITVATREGKFVESENHKRLQIRTQHSFWIAPKIEISQKRLNLFLPRIIIIVSASNDHNWNHPSTITIPSPAFLCVPSFIPSSMVLNPNPLVTVASSVTYDIKKGVLGHATQRSITYFPHPKSSGKSSTTTFPHLLNNLSITDSDNQDSPVCGWSAFLTSVLHCTEFKRWARPAPARPSAGRLSGVRATHR